MSLGKVLNQIKGGDGLLTLLFSFHGYRLGQISGEVNLKWQKVAAQDPTSLTNTLCL